MGSTIKKITKNYAGRNYKKLRTPDKQSLQSRSSQMSKIRSRNTKFEQSFIALLETEFSKRFVTHVRAIRGNPDIVFEKEKLLVFLDSDFWHGWQYPRWKHLLKDDFWREKIEKNRERDKKTTIFLRRNGWTVLRFWEHQLKNEVIVMEKIRKALKSIQ